MHIGRSNGRVLAVLLAFLSTFALTSKKIIVNITAAEAMAKSQNFLFITLAKIEQVSNAIGFLPLIVFIALVLLYSYFFRSKPKFSLSIMICAVLMSVFTLFGISYSNYDDWAFLFSTRFQLFFSFLLFCGYTVLFYVSVNALFGVIQRATANIAGRATSPDWLVKLRSTRFLKTKCALIIMLAWLPVVLIYYPGTVASDGYEQIYSYITGTVTAHHPVLTTYLFGFLFTLGHTLLNEQLGVFLIVMLNMILCAYAFACAMAYILTCELPKPGVLCIFLYFAIYPIWSNWVHVTYKDVLGYPLFTLFMIHFISISKDPAQYRSWKKIAGFGLVALLLCLVRYNNIYVVLLSGLYLLVKGIKRKAASYSLIILLPAILTLLFTYVYLPSTGMKMGSKAEALSVPFQQTARYVKEHPDDMTPEEIAAIDKVLDYAALAEIYNPSISDPVKATYREPSAEELKAYYRVSLSLFLRHPSTYIQAYINHTYSYFYPETINPVKPTFFETTNGGKKHQASLDLPYPWKTETLRAFVSTFGRLTLKTTVFSDLMTPGTNTWILLVLLTWLIFTKQFRKLSPYIPMLVYLASNLLSPVNGYVRYMLPVMACLPLMIAYTIFDPAKRDAALPLKSN